MDATGHILKERKLVGGVKAFVGVPCNYIRPAAEIYYRAAGACAAIRPPDSLEVPWRREEGNGGRVVRLVYRRRDKFVQARKYRGRRVGQIVLKSPCGGHAPDRFGGGEFRQLEHIVRAPTICAAKKHNGIHLRVK